MRVRSLLYSIYDGIFNSCMVGFGETYFSAYAIFLGADNFQMGILSSLPPFIAGVSQFSTVRLMKAIPSRRKLVCFGAFAQAFSIAPLFLAYYFSALRIELYILLVSLYFTCAAVTGPVWNSWMGDLVKVSARGSYFGKRNRVVTVATFFSMTAAGFLLKHFTSVDRQLSGFAVLFLLAFAGRITSSYFLSIKYDPPTLVHLDNASAGFMSFLRELPKKNHGLLVLYMSSVNFAVYTAAAYFTPLMLKELKFNYVTYTLVVAGTAITKSLTYSLWGQFADNWGPRRILKICGLLISFTTLPWLFLTQPFFLFLCQCYTGVVWAGYEISTFTFLLDATEPSERARVSSYLNILSSSFGLAGGLVGAVLFSLHAANLNAYYTVFVLSAALRLVALGAFGSKMKEVRIVSPVRARDILFKSTGFKSALGMTSRIVVFARRRKAG